MNFREYVNEGYKPSSKTKKEHKALIQWAELKGFSVEDDEDGKTFNVYDDSGDPLKSGSFDEIKDFLRNDKSKGRK